jgi:4-hydroxy-L-threonine phosphate dehydrogenase PdxA
MISNSKNKIALTLGDPSGIGPEVIVKALDKISQKNKKFTYYYWRYKNNNKHLKTNGDKF